MDGTEKTGTERTTKTASHLERDISEQGAVSREDDTQEIRQATNETPEVSPTALVEKTNNGAVEVRASTVSQNTDNKHSIPTEQVVPSSLNETNEEEAAGFWPRFIAYVIDVIIIGSINSIILSPLLFVNDGLPIEISFWTLNGIIATVVYYVYFSVMTKYFQQTLGKMIIGLKVVSDTGKNLTWSDIFFREIVGRIIHNVFFILKLLYLTVAFSSKKQGIHDMIASTRVVHVS